MKVIVCFLSVVVGIVGLDWHGQYQTRVRFEVGNPGGVLNDKIYRIVVNTSIFVGQGMLRESDLSDMVFCDSSHAPLTQWMEYYDSSTRLATILLEIASIGASSLEEIWLYMGISDLSETERDVFSDRFAVMSDDDNCNPTYLDNWTEFNERYPFSGNLSSVQYQLGKFDHFHSLTGSSIFSVNDDCDVLSTSNRGFPVGCTTDGHSHEALLQGDSSVVSGNDVLPETYTLSFCKFGYTGYFQDPIPKNSVVMFDSDSAISGWDPVNDINSGGKYVRGAFGSGNVRQSIGSSSHIHTIDAGASVQQPLANVIEMSETPESNLGGTEISKKMHGHDFSDISTDPSANEPPYCNFYFQKFTLDEGTEPFPGIVLMQFCEDMENCEDPPVGWELDGDLGGKHFPRGATSSFGVCDEGVTSSHNHHLNITSVSALGPPPIFRVKAGTNTSTFFCGQNGGANHVHRFEGDIPDQSFLPKFNQVRFLKKKVFEESVTIAKLDQSYSCDGVTVVTSQGMICSGNGTCINSKCECMPGFCGSNCEFLVCNGICEVNVTHPVCFGHGNCLTGDVCECEGSFEPSEHCEHYYCFGLEYVNPLVCAGNGTCASTNNCTCDPGYFHPDCSMWDCFGYLWNESSVCSGGKGSCQGPDYCVCNPGYFGDRCELWECDEILMNETRSVCSGHGNCTGPDYCVCDDHYYPGEAASSFCQSWECFGIIWSNDAACFDGNGTCIGYNNCSCSEGYFGTECDLWKCDEVLHNDTKNVCSEGHGTCVSPDLCVCNEGYYDSEEGNRICDAWNCSLPHDDDSVCNYLNGTCASPENCTCSDEGYYGSECEIWECDGILHNDTEKVCTGRGTCVRPDFCVCDEGYYPGGKNNFCERWNCSDIPMDDSSACNFGNGTCSSHNNCSCREEYSGEECEIWYCNGVSRFDEENVCSMNGVCLGPEVCSCDNNVLIAGEYCQIFDCFDIPNNVTSDVCSGHGDCLHPNHCVCGDNYTHSSSGNQNCSSWKCFGIYHDDVSSEEKVCNGHGNCTGPDVCECVNMNYTGPSCENWMCYEKLNSDVLACFDKGRCVDVNFCNCTKDGWSGDECNTPACFGTVSSDISVCAGHGTCVSVDSCLCIGDYVNSREQPGGPCDSWYCGDYERSNTSSPICNNHGSCESPGLCECTDDFEGSLCETWKCGMYYYEDSSVCNGHGSCDSPGTCTCETNSDEDDGDSEEQEEEYFGYFGNSCEIKFGNRFILATKSVLASFFEMKTSYLEEYGLPPLVNEVEGEFECSKILQMDESMNHPYKSDLLGDFFRNCSVSRMNEFSAFSGATLYLKVFINHIEHEKLLEVLKFYDFKLDLLIVGKPFTVEVYPYENVISTQEKFTMKLFKGYGDSLSTSTFSTPIPETDVCKSRLQLDEQCIETYECYPIASDLDNVGDKGIELQYKFFSVGYYPSIEDKAYYFTKFYFRTREACELGMGYSTFKRFSLVSCNGGQGSGSVNFQMYDRCQNELVDMFFNSQVLTYFLMTSSPMYLIFTCCFLFLCCCSANICIFCVRSILIKLGIWKHINFFIGRRRKLNQTVRDDEGDHGGDVGLFDDVVGIVEKDEELKDIKSLGYTTTAVEKFNRIGGVEKSKKHKKQIQDTTLKAEKDDDESESSESTTDDSDDDNEEAKMRRIEKSTSFEHHVSKKSKISKMISTEVIIDGNTPGIVVVNDDNENHVNKEEEEEEQTARHNKLEELDIDLINEEYLEAEENSTDITTPLRSACSDNPASEVSTSPTKKDLQEQQEEEEGEKKFGIEHLKSLFRTFEREFIKKKSRESGESQYDVDPRIFAELKQDFKRFEKESFESVFGMLSRTVSTICKEQGLKKVKSSGNVKMYNDVVNDDDNNTSTKGGECDDEKSCVNRNRGGIFGRIRCLLCWIGCWSCCCCQKCIRPCINDFAKCVMMVMFILVKEGFALWFSSSEFLSSDDVDTNNEHYILLVSIMNLNQYIIWASILLYLLILLVLIIIFVERFFFDPLMFCVSFGSLREYVYFRIFKSLFLLWFICINMFCYITKFAYLDSNEQYNSLVSPMFYFSIVFPETLLIFSLFGVLSYNGVSSHVHCKRFKSLGIRGMIKFPKVSIGLSQCGKDCDVILEDFFQLIFLLEKKDAYRGEYIVKELSRSNEYGHLNWDYLNGLSFDQVMYLKEFFFPKEFEEETYMTIFHHHRIWSLKWVMSVVLFPFLCLFGYTGV